MTIWLTVKIPWGLASPLGQDRRFLPGVTWGGKCITYCAQLHGRCGDVVPHSGACLVYQQAAFQICFWDQVPTRGRAADGCPAPVTWHLCICMAHILLQSALRGLVGHAGWGKMCGIARDWVTMGSTFTGVGLMYSPATVSHYCMVMSE